MSNGKNAKHHRTLAFAREVQVVQCKLRLKLGIVINMLEGLLLI